jgi:hypothetical protein
VTSLEELKVALGEATDGDTVALDPDAEVDLTGAWELRVPRGVTLHGGRDASTPGALLVSPPGDWTPPSATTTRKLELSTDARLTGVRLRGHNHEYVNPELEHDGDYYAHRGGGGVTVSRGGTVDNCAISGWPYAAVVARGDAHVHDNHVHHNTWEGLGYGIAIPEGNHEPLIEANYFDYNRHSITGAGGPRVGFVARDNVVGERWVGSQFDMHGTEGMAGVAGDRIVVENNTFRATRAVEAKSRDPGGRYSAVDIRGTPTEGAWIESNWFYHDDRDGALRQPEGGENVHFADNHFGRTDPPGDVGAATDRVVEPRHDDR